MGRGRTLPEEKLCAVCARPIAWRKKWERSWEQVKYCSDACRRGRSAALGEAGRGRLIEDTIAELLKGAAPGATICPSEAARAVSPGNWSDWMPEVKNAARRMAAAGRLRILQGGREVDGGTARGPIRLGRAGSGRGGV